MKKTLSVNLGGFVYQIDEDAYHELMDYLQDVKRHLGDETSSEEVLNDIEQRISELFTQWMQGKREVITVFDVRKVIDVLGRPEQFDSPEGEANSESEKNRNAQNGDGSRSSGAAQRKWYRDTENAILGGVCSGLAAYLNVSVVLVRLLFFFLIWFWCTGLILYFVCWIIIPEARTAAQRLEMRGEDVTIENIEKNVREEYDKVKDRVEGYVNSDRFQQKMHSTENGFITFFRGCAKVFLAFIAGIFILVGFSILIALIIGLVAVWSGTAHMAMPWMHHMMPFQEMLMDPVAATCLSIGSLLVIGIPFVAIFRLLFGKLLKIKPAHNWEFWVGLIFWFIGIALCAFISMSCLTNYGGTCM